jgi:hypothetical protein
MSALVFGGLFEIGSKLIDKLFTSPEEKAKAQLELVKMQQDGELKDMQVRLSAILAEAQSSDPWTSRARPSFLYVCYLLILFGIPMGIVSAVSPQTGTNIAAGFGGWLKAIPPDIVDLMGWVMLGYIGGRSFEKIKGAAK